MKNGFDIYRELVANVEGTLRAAKISVNATCYAITTDRAKPMKQRFSIVSRNVLGELETELENLDSLSAVKAFKARTGYVCGRWIEGSLYSSKLELAE